MLTGQPPFLGDDAVSIISQHLHADPVPPSRHNPEVPEALDRAVLGLLAKSRGDRYASAAEARELLLAALEERAGRDRRGGAGGEPARQPRRRGLRRSRAGARADARRRRRGDRRPRPDAAGDRASRESARPGRPRSSPPTRKVNGARVHWGRCREDDGAPAYWPWVQAIRSFVREADPVGLAWQMGGGAAEIAQLVPEVRRAARHRAGLGRATARRRASASSTPSPASWSRPPATGRS